MIMAILLLCASSLNAQEQPGAWKRFVGFLSPGIDTAYVKKPAKKWRVQFKVPASDITLNVNGINNDVPFEINTRSDIRFSLSFSINYRGLGFSLSVNPNSLAGKYTDFNLGFTGYGSRFGIEAYYHRGDSFKGTIKSGENGSIPLDKGTVFQRSSQINTYWVLNRRRFSFPAAMTRSRIQTKSAGSFLAGLSSRWQSLNVNEISAGQGNGLVLRYYAVTLSAGYGYNWALPKNWMIHISAMPGFVVLSSRKCRLDGAPLDWRYHFPEVIITGRGAVIHEMDPMFLGLSMVFNYSNSGNPQLLQVKNTQWSAQVFIGVRF